MRIKKSMAALAAGVMLTGAALVAAAMPAAAIDEGTLLPGGIYWFDTVGPLSDQTPANQLFGGSGTARPWVSLTTENPCPAGTASLQAYVRIPQAGVPENDWVQIPIGAPTTSMDGDGRLYTTAVTDRLAQKAEVQTYVAAHGGEGDFPFLAVCRTAPGVSTGYFRTMVHIAVTDMTMLTDAAWNLIDPVSCNGSTECTGGVSSEAQATTTTLTAAASGADLILTATVAPAGAAGTVTFKDGSTTLGTAPVAAGVATYTVTEPAAGTHAFTAGFVPSDPAAYAASSGSLTVGLALDEGQLVITLEVPPADEPVGALTFSVPFDVPVHLAGSRPIESRVTASGAFPTVTVTDTRRDDMLTGWEVNAQSSEFVGPDPDVTVGAKYLGWVPVTTATPDDDSPLLTQNGAQVLSFLDDSSSGGLSVPSTLGRAATPGRGTATLNATLNLAIPGETPQGSYTATVTVTLIPE